MNDTAVEQDSCSRQKSQRSCLNKIINIRHFHKINENWKKKEKKKKLLQISTWCEWCVYNSTGSDTRWSKQMSWAIVMNSNCHHGWVGKEESTTSTQKTCNRKYRGKTFTHSTSTQIIPQVYVNLGQYKDSFYLNVNDSLKSAVCKI